MEKELLERKKVALNKLLKNKEYFSTGLCLFIAVLYTKNILTYEEHTLIGKMLDSFYAESQDAREAGEYYGGYLWEPTDWESREKWILYNLETIDLLLNSTKQSK